MKYCGAMVKTFQATVVSVPTVRPCAWSYGTGLGVTRTIVELTDADGLIGLGECEGAYDQVIGHVLGPAVVGEMSTALQRLRNAAHLGFADTGSLNSGCNLKPYSAIEMALLDLQGRQTGLPVYELLGGPVRLSAEFGAYRYSFHLPTSGILEKDVPQAMADYAVAELQRTGCNLFEFKVGRMSRQTDIETIRTVRSAVGDSVALGVDANMRYSPGDARFVMQAVRDANLSWFEEPVATLSGMSRLYEETKIPISCHCTDLEKLNCFSNLEGVAGDVQVQGGMRGIVRDAAAIVQGLKRQFWLRSCLELGVSWAAMVHLAMACPDINRASQTLIDWVEDDLVEGPTWSVGAGQVKPPARAGLGVVLDREALQRYAERYRQGIAYSYFDDK